MSQLSKLSQVSATLSSLCDGFELPLLNAALSSVSAKARAKEKLHCHIHNVVCVKLATIQCAHLDSFPRLEGKGCVLDCGSSERGLPFETLRPICYCPTVHIMEFLEELCSKIDEENAELQSLVDALRKKTSPSKKKSR